MNQFRHDIIFGFIIVLVTLYHIFWSSVWYFSNLWVKLFIFSIVFRFCNELIIIFKKRCKYVSRILCLHAKSHLQILIKCCEFCKVFHLVTIYIILWLQLYVFLVCICVYTPPIVTPFRSVHVSQMFHAWKILNGFID